MKVLTLILPLALLGGWTAWSRPRQTPEQRFKNAENTFRFQDYPRAVRQLQALLYPRPVLKDPAMVKKAHEYLGACFYWLKKPKRMDEEFTALLVQAPQYKLDPFYYPVPLIEHFNALRKRLAALGIIKPAQKKQKKTKKSSESQAKSRKTQCRTVEKRIVKHSKLLCYIPFGVGQFANNRPGKAAGFLSTQLIGLGVNIGSFAAIEALRGDDGLFSHANAHKARILRYVQYAGLGLFLASAIWGIFDALHDFKKQEVKTRIIITPCPKGMAVGVKF